ncbi:hypothetical protein K5D56_05890 [Pseudomonas cichorii]|nr:hypothetical protein [Pseudomonas cichorii]MBX8588902.1 hypothetical protein [Pseudomonas cichorii]
MSWEKIGKFLVAVISCLASITGIYVVFKEDTKLEAYLSYDYQTYPRQFSDRMDKASDKLKYGYLYDNIKAIANDSLSHDQIDKMVGLSRAPYIYMFDSPLKKVENYPVRLFIYLENSGDKVVKNVSIKLPAKGVVHVRDDSRNYMAMDELTSNVEVPSIVQNGVYKLWVYFEGDLEEIKSEGVYIGYSDGVALVKVYEEFVGFKAGMAKYSEEVMLLLGVLVIFLLLAICFIFFNEEDFSSSSGSN